MRRLLRRAWFGPLVLAASWALAPSLASWPAAAAEQLTSAQLASPPVAMPLPAYLQPAKDPAFGVPFTRVTKPGPLGAGIICGPGHCSHRYSSAQAWNADQSLLVIVNGCNGLCFLDGHSYVPLFRRTRAGECEWHPRNAEVMICVSGQTVSYWAPRANLERPVYTAEGHRNLQFGPYKGNPSLDGHRIVIRALSARGALVAFAYDLAARKKFPDITLGTLPGRNNACSISPLGDYVYCLQSLPDETNQTFIFTVEGKLVQSWTENHRPGHGDMTVDADGHEVYVGISKSEPDLFQVIKRRLDDGTVTALSPYSEAQHASLRALQRPGWVFLSYSGDFDEVGQHPAWAPFAREILALKIDGSGEIRRIAQTRNAPHDYWSETHASPSPDGSQVIWSSNWGQPGGPVFDFVSRLDWPDKAAARQSAKGP
jgi:hypothetical protein